MIMVNRDMPESCRYCPLCRHYPSNGTTWCNDKNRLIATNWDTEPLNEKPDWCELKEVPNNNVGKWIDIGDYVLCSRCGSTYYGADKNYCPNCGKKMENADG